MVTTFEDRMYPWMGKHIKEATGVYESGVRYDTAREALMGEGLDWEVVKTPLFYVAHGEWGANYESTPNHVATIRATDEKLLGVVGVDYEPQSNRRLAEFTDTLMDTTATSGVTMGTLRNDTPHCI